MKSFFPAKPAVAALMAAVSLTACAGSAPPPAAASHQAPASDQINVLADDFVKLSLEAGTHEAGYIDAYYGPEEWQKAATATPRSKPQLIAAAQTLIGVIDQLAPRYHSNPSDTQRLRALKAQLVAAETRLQMMEGKHFTFADEAERLFGLRPNLRPLASYDAPLQQLDKMLAGEGSLADRVEALSARFTIPTDRLQPVFEKSIALCRRQSAAHIAMPSDESFALGFVTGKSWSGYNYYQGNFHSKIDVNTDFPIRLPRAIDLGCHEGYPGHHLLNMKLEEKLVRGRGWREFSVYPLYSPLSLIAEGSANYGIRLAFPDGEKRRIEREVLLPLAGITPPTDDLYWRVQDALSALSGARLTIAQQYLDGMIDRSEGVRLTQKYLLLTPERADQSIRFTEQYRSYVINYGLGEALVRQYVEAGGADKALRWQRMERIISEPTLPSDLIKAD